MEFAVTKLSASCQQAVNKQKARLEQFVSNVQAVPGSNTQQSGHQASQQYCQNDILTLRSHKPYLQGSMLNFVQGFMLTLSQGVMLLLSQESTLTC